MADPIQLFHGDSCVVAGIVHGSPSEVFELLCSPQEQLGVITSIKAGGGLRAGCAAQRGSTSLRCRGGVGREPQRQMGHMAPRACWVLLAVLIAGAPARPPQPADFSPRLAEWALTHGPVARPGPSALNAGRQGT